MQKPKFPSSVDHETATAKYRVVLGQPRMFDRQTLARDARTVHRRHAQAGITQRWATRYAGANRPLELFHGDPSIHLSASNQTPWPRDPVHWPGACPALTQAIN